MSYEQFKRDLEDRLVAIIAAKIENAIGIPSNCLTRTEAMQAAVEVMDVIMVEYQKQLNEWAGLDETEPPRDCEHQKAQQLRKAIRRATTKIENFFPSAKSLSNEDGQELYDIQQELENSIREPSE